MPYIANPLEGIPLVNTFITDQSLLGATPATDDVLIIYDQSATALKQLTIAELQASVLASPAFTGVPTAPTANAGTATTQLATTAFVTTATTALNTIDEMTDTTISSVGANEVLKWSGSAWINQTLAEANILPAAGPTFTGVLTVGSAVISESDLELIDDLTAGTVVVSKAVTVDGNKDVGTIRNLTIDGTFSDGNYTFDTNGNVSGLGTIASGAITSSGIIKTDATTNATSITDGSLQTDGGLSVTLDAILGDDLTLISDAAVLNFGVNSDVSLTHVHDTGLLLNSSRKIQFGDAGTFIHQSADGVLTIESDTTVDINGAVDISGVLTMSGGTLDMSGEDVDNIRSATFIAEVNGGTGSAAIDWGAGQKQYVTLSGNVTLNFTNPDGPCNLMLKVIHSGGGRTVTWDSSPDVKWAAGTAPTLSAAAGTDLVAFYFDGSVYYGSASVGFA